MHAEIVVDGSPRDESSLREWLRHEPEIRHQLADAPRPAGEGTLGTTADLVVQVAATAGGATAVWAALARSLSVWLTQRHSDVSLTVTGTDGRKVTINAKRVVDAEKLVRQVLDTVPETPED
ncbi:hypothetical protein [Actinoplanes sp. GCM10030250]|uniref:effector-associated constant component EACC1 n=1 Tax=Actinoplanes sp. GCM10030250 TaxID=3273376 RepID=UPI0036245E92